MKFFAALLAGTLLGAALVGVALYCNPFMQEASDAADADSGDWVLGYGFPIEGTTAFTHGGASRLPLKPTTVAPLWESTIERTALSVFPLQAQNEPRPRMLASRISVPAEDSEPVLRGMILSDYWLLTVPGEGSLFMSADSNLWSFLRQTVVPVWYFGRPWRGPASYRPMAGPAPDGTALVHGATGRFRGLEGNAVEHYLLEGFSRQRGPEKLSVRLAVTLHDSPAAASSVPTAELGRTH